MIDKEPNIRRYEFNNDSDEAPCLFTYRPENITAPFKSITTMRGRAAQSQGKGRKFRTWIEHEKEFDRKIEQLEREIKIAERNFKEEFGIEVEQAPAEIGRIREEIREKEYANNVRNARIAELEELQEAVALEYQTQMLLIESHPDKEEIYRLLKEMEG